MQYVIYVKRQQKKEEDHEADAFEELIRLKSKNTFFFFFKVRATVSMEKILRCSKNLKFTVFSLNVVKKKKKKA